ncbi:MAG TPA: hypothetical protein VLV56_17265 [Burkholderiales bacterium]|nr:hypothetical protein [Burkholderiales bacterium]
MRNTKALVGALLAVVGWTVIFFALLNWWAVTTASERAVSPIGLVANELERVAPTLLYFFVVGLLLGRVLGPRAGAAWALVAAMAAMVIHALLTQRVLYAGLDLMTVALLAVDYFLPLVSAVAGAATSRLWRSSTSGAGPT